FLLPIWFGSSTWPSVNLIVPILLAGLAVFSCFDVQYERYVLRRPGLGATSSAIILFAALVAAIPVFFHTSLMVNVAVSAALGTLAGVCAILPAALLKSRRGAAIVFGAVAFAAGVALIIAPLLPPVPVQCLRHEATREIRDREPAEPSGAFDEN